MSGPLPGVPRTLLRPMAWAYGVAVARRNRRFDADEGIRRIALPVLSIGNLVAGGSGKTPMTAWLAQRLLAEGVRPMIALRGYGAARPELADEALEYAKLLPGVPIAAGADRAATIERALEGGAVADVVLLDDGFQHRRLHRDLDLVLVDAGRPCLDGDDAELLPAGWLREPPEALRRASAVIVTHAESGESARGTHSGPQSSGPPRAERERTLAQTIDRLHGQPPVAWFRHTWSGVDVHEPSHHADRAVAARVAPVSHLRGLPVATLFGVAQPGRVRAMLEDAGAVVELDIPLRDHQRYDSELIRGVAAKVAEATSAAKRISAIVTTPKDWTKLAAFAAALPCPVVVPRLEVAPVAGGDALLELALRCVRRTTR